MPDITEAAGLLGMGARSIGSVPGFPDVLEEEPAMTFEILDTISPARSS
jgi:hypothetical protein